MSLPSTISLDPTSMLKPRRKIKGISAILLPLTADGEVDWSAFNAHVRRTASVGLTPAVNMDTGYVNLIDDELRQRILIRTREVLGGSEFVAGTHVQDAPGASFDCDAYLRQIEPILENGGTPIIFQSYGLTALSDDAIIAAYEQLGSATGRFIAFELGRMFAEFGLIYSLDVFRGLIENKNCLGAKHSSLRREPEWQRLQLRDALRPDFRVFTGNDLAIDMVMYGSDYLLGLSTFAPDLFSRRDDFWLAGDPAFYELNDMLQFLGRLAFRTPVSAYKHSAAMFLRLRGWLDCDSTHPASLKRPDTDWEILRETALSLGVLSEAYR